jgi:hypothetical protein
VLVFKFICALILRRQTSELKELQNKKSHSDTALAGCAIDPMCATKMVRNVELFFSTPWRHIGIEV